MKIKIIGIVAGIVFSASASALEITPIFNLGYDFGGEDLLIVHSYYGTDKITSGSGYMLNGGVSLWLDDDSAIQITAGYKDDSQTYSNGSTGFSRIPFDALYVTRLDRQIRLGVGMTYHMSPTLECNISGVCSGSLSANSATGFIGEIDLGTPRLGTDHEVFYGLRYTNISYQFSTAKVDGSSFGFIMGFAFH